MAQNAKEKAYEYIKKYLIENDSKDDLVLSETAIADAIGVSRTPVREAMNLLTFEGWLVFIPNKGHVKAKLGLEDIIMISQILMGLEGVAARVSCETADRQELKQLRESFMALGDLTTPSEIDKERLLGHRLHEIILQSTNNKRLITFTDSMLFQRRSIGFLSTDGNVASDLARKRRDQHLEIIDAILERDPDRAEDAMRKHVSDVGVDATNALCKTYFR